jgi:hypothetical protein
LIEQFHRDESRDAKENAQERIDEKRSHGDQERRREIVGPFVQDVAGRISKAKIANVEDSNAAQLAEK